MVNILIPRYDYSHCEIQHSCLSIGAEGLNTINIFYHAFVCWKENGNRNFMIAKLVQCSITLFVTDNCLLFYDFHRNMKEKSRQALGPGQGQVEVQGQNPR